MEEQNNATSQAPAGSPPDQSSAQPQAVTPTVVPTVAPITPETPETPVTPVPVVAEPTVAPTSSEPLITEPQAATVAEVVKPEVPAPVVAPEPSLTAPAVASQENVVAPPPLESEVAAAPATGPVAPNPSTPVQAPVPAVVHHGGKMKFAFRPSRKKIAFGLFGMALLIAFGSVVYFAMGQKKANDEVASLKARIQEIDSNVHDIPEGAIKLSECVPNMGFHYMEQGVDPKFGPLILVNTKGKVIGYEYMFNDSMLTEIPDAGIPLEVLLTNGPVLLNDWQYNSIDFSRATAGHPGFEDDHFDVHLYTVDPEEQKRACE